MTQLNQGQRTGTHFSAQTARGSREREEDADDSHGDTTQSHGPGRPPHAPTGPGHTKVPWARSNWDLCRTRGKAKYN